MRAAASNCGPPAGSFSLPWFQMRPGKGPAPSGLKRYPTSARLPLLKVTRSFACTEETSNSATMSALTTRRSGRSEGRPRGDRLVPGAQRRVPRPPVEVRVARFHAERAGEREVDHVERPLHQRMGDLALPEIGHAHGAIGFVRDHARRALVLRARRLAPPDRETVEHAPRERFEPPSLPAGGLELRLALELVEVVADDLRLLHAN